MHLDRRPLDGRAVGQRVGEWNSDLDNVGTCGLFLNRCTIDRGITTSQNVHKRRQGPVGLQMATANVGRWTQQEDDPVLWGHV